MLVSAKRACKAFLVGATASAMMGLSATPAAQALSGSFTSAVTRTADGTCTAAAPQTSFRISGNYVFTTADPGGLDTFQVLLIDADDLILGANSTLFAFPGAVGSQGFSIPVTLNPGDAPFRFVMFDDNNTNEFAVGSTYTAAGTAAELDVAVFDPSVLDSNCPVPPQPEIGIFGNGVAIVDGDATPSAADHTDFGGALVGAPVVRTYTVENTGTAVLNITNVSVSGANPGDFAVTSGPSATVGIGGSTTFDVTFTPGAQGARSAVITVENDDFSEADYDFAVAGAGTAPEINVQFSGDDIPNGLTGNDPATNFGRYYINSPPVSRTFTIENLGDGPLDVTSVTVAGMQAVNYSVTSFTPGAVAAGGTLDFTIEFDPSNVNRRRTTVTIANSDADEDPYTFEIRGNVEDQEIDISGNGVSIADGDSTPSSADDTDFGLLSPPVTPVTRTFTISNSGAGNANHGTLTVDSISVSGANPGDFTVTGFTPGTEVAAGATTTFDVTFDPAGTGASSAIITVVSDDPDETDYDFAVSGAVPTPPVQPIIDLPAVSDLGVADDDDITSIGAVSFDITTDPGDNIQFYQWDLNNDGTPEFTLTSPSHSFAQAEGSTTYTLTVINEFFLSSTSDPVTVTIDRTDPTVALILRQTPASETTNADSLTFRVTFSEDVGEVDAGDFVGVGTTATAAVTPVSDSVYDVTLSGGDLASLEGAVSLGFAGGQDIIDVAGNTLTDTTPASEESYTLDNTAPVLTSVWISSDNTIDNLARPGDTVSVAISSDEDITTPSVTIGGIAASVSGSGSSYTANAVMTGAVSDGVLAISIDSYADNVGNVGATVSATTDASSVIFDGTAPDVTISGVPALTNAPFTATFTFSENVNGFGVGDITLANASAGAFSSVTPNIYTALITPAADGAVTIDVAAAVATDIAGNDNTAATQAVSSFDGTAPTIASILRQDPAGNPTNADSLTFRVTFSEDVVNVGAADFAPAGTTAGAAVSPVSASVYDVTLTGGDLAGLNGDVSLDLAGGQDVADVAGNALVDTVPASEESYTLDNSPPVLTTVSIASDNADSSLARVGDTVTVSLVANENVTTPSVTIGAIAASVSGSGSAYSASAVMTGAVGDGPIAISINGYADDIGNAGATVTATTDASSVTFDGTAPTVTLSTVSSDPVSGAFTLDVTFSEPVTGFDVSDIIVGNGSASAFAGSGAAYSALITPAADGPVTADVASAAAQDAAGNDNDAAAQFTIESDETAPTVTLSTVSTDPVSGAFTLDVTFSEPVTGFDISDIVVGNGSASAFAGSGAVYSALITPATDGAVTADVGTGAAVDAAGNDNVAAAQFSIGADGTPPTVTLSSVASDPVSGAFTLDVVFSESVTGFDVGDIVVANGSASAFAGSGAVYSALITPAGDGAVTADVATGAAQDAAGNDNTAAAQFSIENDETAPTVTLSTVSSDPVSGAFTLDVTFSEPVTGFDLGDIVVGNGSASALSGSGAVYSVLITPAADGSVTADVGAASAQDAAGNDNAVAAQFTIENDETAPTVTLSTVSSDPVSGVFTLDVVFSEPVTGFDVGDIVVGNGSASALSGSGAVYSAQITPAGDGAVTADVGTGAAQDAAGNDNVASAQFSIGADGTPPMVTLSTVASDPVSGAFTLDVTFSEPVTGFDVSDILVGNGSASAFAGSGAVYSALITPAADGTVTADVAAGAAQDSAANDNAAAVQFTIENDETAPTVTLSTASSDPVSGAFTLDVTFSEPVTGFDVGDIAVGNGSASAFAGSGAVYSALITPAADGAVTADVGAASAQDAAGNDNAAAAQFTIENDGTAPSVTLSSTASDPVSGAFTLDVTFSEPVTGFDVSDILVGNGSASAFAGSGAVYSALITPAADGSVTADVGAGAAQDTAGNDNTAATQFSIVNDETAPTVTLSTVSSDPVSGAFTLDVTFSEPVTGFDVSDILVGNGSASGFAGSGAVYSALITPASDGAVTADVASGAAQDSAGNDNTAAAQFTIESDETAPTVTLSTASSDPVSGAFTLDVTFSEPVTGFDVGDIVVGNGSASSFAGAGAVYSVVINPASDGTVTADVGAASAQDAAGNDNTAAAQFTIEADGSAPDVSLSTTASDPVSGAFTLDVTFTEPVTGFNLGDIVVGNGSASAFSGSGAVYSALITPAGDGAVTANVGAGAAQDAAGNDNTAAAQFSIENDETAPTVTLSTASSDPVSGAFTLDVVFSEPVTGFDVSDILVGNGSASAFAGSGAVYSALITPASDGAVTADVAGAAAQDGAGNDNTAAAQFTIDADGTAPTVTISAPPATVNAPFTLTFTFSEGVSGFAVGDIVVGNGSAGAFNTVSASEYSALITPTASGLVTIDVNAGAANDTAGNASTAASQVSTQYDADAPSVASASGSPDPVTDAHVGASTFALAVTFSEPMNTSVDPTLSFPNEDPSATLTFASGSWSGDQLTYTALYDVADASDAIADIDVGVSGASDAIGNVMTPETAADVFSIDMAAGEIVIALATSGGDASFDFTSATPGLTTTLTTSGGTASLTVSDLVPGAYDLTQVMTTGFELTDLSCADPDSGSSVDLASSSATIDLDNRETVTCTFTNTAQGDLVIAVDTLGQDGAFDFTGDLGAFTVSTAGLSGSTSFSTVASGLYVVQFENEAGFDLTNLACTGDTDAGTSVDLASRTASIDVDPGEAITCAFEATAEPALDIASDVSVSLELPEEYDDPTAISTSFAATNTGGAPLTFSASTDVAWLSVDPTSGTIAPGATLNFTVAFTSAVESLAPGSYTGNVTIVNQSASSASVSGAGAGKFGGDRGKQTTSAVAVTIPVTVNIVARDGGLRIAASTSPQPAAGDASFTYASDAPGLNGVVLTTAGGAATSEAVTVNGGVYSVTQDLPEGWSLNAISCVGDDDGGSVVDLAARSVSIDLDPNENIVCTFENVRDETYVRELTQRIIAGFMAERADRILEASPRLSDRLRARSTSPGGVQFDIVGNRASASFNASLSGMRAASAARDAAGLQTGVGNSSPRRAGSWTEGLDVWVQGSWSSVSEDRAGLADETDFATFHLGADYLISDGLLVGASAAFDWTDTTSGALGSTVSGEGWLVGPYVVARIGEALYMDARASWGRSTNDVNPLGTYEDEFETSRYLLEANLAGDIEAGAWRIRPEAGLAYFGETQEAYTDSLGFNIPEQSIDILRLRAGSEIAYRFEGEDGSFVEPFAAIRGIYDLQPAEVPGASGLAISLDDLRASVRTGIAAQLSNGATLSGSVNFDGLGADGFEASGGQLRLTIPLQAGAGGFAGAMSSDLGALGYAGAVDALAGMPAQLRDVGYGLSEREALEYPDARSPVTRRRY